MEWFYANGANRMGPISAVAFENLLKDQHVTTETLVWSTGMTDWQPWGTIQSDTAVCAASGGRFWQRDMVPFEGKFISAERKEDYFQRVRENVTQPGQLVYGSFIQRLAAKFIDGIIGWLMGVVVNLGLSVLFFGSFIFQPKPTAGNVGLFWAYQGTALLIGIGLGVAYSWFFLSRYAATPGKMAMGLKVVRSDGSPLTTGRIVGRYFAEMLSSLILGIGYLMAGFDEQRRTLHDRICDTRVIKK